MVARVLHEPDYEVKVFCPSCGSVDVVLESENGYFHFYSCTKCKYKINNDIIRRNFD